MKNNFKFFLKFGNIALLAILLLVPFLLFLNRFLIPDVSYDSLNYHLFLGQRGVDTSNSKYEFYPTGLHNFSTILEVPGYVLMRMFGYRLGSVASLIFLYLSIIVLYKIFRLYQPKFKILDTWWWGLMFGSAFLSFEAFLQLAIYFVDIHVAFLSLLGCYLLFKYEKSKNIWDLVWSSLTMSVLFLGKMTAGYILPAYFLYLFYVLVADKNLIWKVKIFRLLLGGLLVISFSIPWWYQNYQKTGNPIFPYYNTIFKSEFYSQYNFTQESSGGDTVIEKLFWGIYSAKDPSRLGQAHDLFHDYKINIYFVMILFIFIYSLIKKDGDFIKLSAFYLISFETWAWVFGYLRYGIGLEFLGGIILLLWLVRLKGLSKYVIILPLLALMFLQDKRVVNLGLAYDLSFRPGYFYNRLSYPKELSNFNKNKIEIDKSLIEKYQPLTFLNCSTPITAYYVVSDFSNLPVYNVDRQYYPGMTEKKLYIDKSIEVLKNKIGGQTTKFVTIMTSSGLNVNEKQCLDNLKSRSYVILGEQEISFLGYEGQKLKVIFGEFNW
ncbi:MAG: hypothetical protein WC503_06395 [Candidatus Shapirobacteria bacterium]